MRGIAFVLLITFLFCGCGSSSTANGENTLVAANSSPNTTDNQNSDSPTSSPLATFEAAISDHEDFQNQEPDSDSNEKNASKEVATSLVTESAKDSNFEEGALVSGVTFLNLSGILTTDLEQWAEVAENKMASQNARVLTVLYNIGGNLGPEDPDRFAGFPFTPNEVLLTKRQIDDLMAGIEDWLRSDPCMGRIEQRNHLRNELRQYRVWLEEGADTSTQRALCEETRFVMMAFESGGPIWDLQRFLVHELYHAFQQDLEGDCNETIDRRGRGDHVPVVVEGAAEYFTFFTAGELYNDPDTVSTMLKEAKTATTLDQSDDVMGSGMATRAAALVRLMIERGQLDHQSIIDGSFFHNCQRSKLDGSNPEFRYAMDNWNQIEQEGTEWKFTASALAGNP